MFALAFTSLVLTEAYKVNVCKKKIGANRFQSFRPPTANIFSDSFWNLSESHVQEETTHTKKKEPETTTATKAPSPIDVAYGTKAIDVIKAWLADEHRRDHVSGFLREATGDIVKLDMKDEVLKVRDTIKTESLKWVDVYSVVPIGNHSEVELGPVARGEISTNQAICFSVVVSIAGIRVDWLGIQDKRQPCQLSMQHMASWLKGLHDFSSTHFPSYGDMWMFRDVAQGTCKYLKSNEANVFHSYFRLTLFSMFKYGMPFYTYKFGVLPLGVIDEAQEVVDGAPQPKQTAFCDLCVKAKALGELTLGEIVEELEDESAAYIVEVAARLTDWHAITLRDLFKNKRIWTDTQENIKKCEDLKAFVVALLRWPCKDSSDLNCDAHAKVAQAIDKLEVLKDYARFIGDAAANRRAMCPQKLYPQFDMAWRWRTFGSQGFRMPWT